MLEVDDSDDELDGGHDSDATEIDGDASVGEDGDTEQAYMSTKSMGDADCQVSFSCVHINYY